MSEYAHREYPADRVLLKIRREFTESEAIRVLGDTLADVLKENSALKKGIALLYDYKEYYDDFLRRKATFNSLLFNRDHYIQHLEGLLKARNIEIAYRSPGKFEYKEWVRANKAKI